MIVNRSALLNAATLCSKVAANRPTLPLLSNVALTLDTDRRRLCFAATDLEIWLTLDIEVNGPLIADPITPVGVPAAELARVVKALDGPEVELKVYGESALSVGGIMLAAMSIAEFPVAPKFESAPPCAPVTAPGLYEAMATALTVASKDASRYALNGVYIDLNKGNVVATDGHRLIRVEIAKIKEFPKAGTQILPRLLVERLVSFRKLANMDQIVFTENKGSLSFGFPISGASVSGWLSGRPIEGTFPSYEQVIPKNESAKTTLQVNREAFGNVLDRAIGLAARPQYMVELICNKTVRVHVKNENTEAMIEVPTATYTGPDIVIGVNCSYLRAVNKLLKRDEVTIQFSDAVSPLWIVEGEKAPKKTPASWIQAVTSIVIMPMRTNFTLAKKEEVA